MYYRTYSGFINKIISIKNFNEREYLLNGFYINKDTIKKASYNIIDILEEGDYVNGYPIYEIIEYPDNTKAIVIADDNESIIWEENSQYIKSIVTKEQFEQMAYKVGE